MAINQLIANPMIADTRNFSAPIQYQRQQNALAAMPSNYGGNPLMEGMQYGTSQEGDPRRGMFPTDAVAKQSGSVGEIGERLISDLQRDFGLKREQAAGIVGNLAHESGGFNTLQEVKPLVEGSRGGFGYAQWTGPRRRAFEKWASEKGLDPSSYDANYGFLKYELMQTPEGRILPAIQSAQTVDDATRLFSERFLRPGIPHMNNRLALARRYLG